MTALLVAGQLLAFLGMVAVSLWGRKHMPDEARVPARLGTTGFDYTLSKKTSLLYQPVIGSFIVVGTLAVVNSDDAMAIAAVGLALLVFLLMAHWFAIRRAAS